MAAVVTKIVFGDTRRGLGFGFFCQFLSAVLTRMWPLFLSFEDGVFPEVLVPRIRVHNFSISDGPGE